MVIEMGVIDRDQRLFTGMVVVKTVVVSVAEIGVEKDLGVLGIRVEVEVPSESHLGTNDLNDNIDHHQTQQATIQQAQKIEKTPVVATDTIKKAPVTSATIASPALTVTDANTIKKALTTGVNVTLTQSTETDTLITASAPTRIEIEVEALRNATENRTPLERILINLIDQDSFIISFF